MNYKQVRKEKRPEKTPEYDIEVLESEPDLLDNKMYNMGADLLAYAFKFTLISAVIGFFGYALMTPILRFGILYGGMMSMSLLLPIIAVFLVAIRVLNTRIPSGY